jgi:hypothetical protein
MPLLVTPHQVTFTPEQLARAKKLAHARAAPLRTVQRAQLTLLVAEHPEISHPEAAKQVGLHADTVYAWRRRWATAGWSLMQDQETALESIG